jgi:hypothetical protein
MVKAADHLVGLLVVLFMPLTVVGQPLLQRIVQVDADRVRLDQALALVAQDGKFKLSYNAAMVPGDSLVDVSVNGTVAKALRTLVGDRFELKETGNHIILLDKSGARRKFHITGALVDAGTGGPLAQAYVHEVDGKNAVTTDGLGTFRLEVTGERDRTALLVMRKEYHDTIVYVGRDGQLGRLALKKRAVVLPLEPLCIHERCGVEDLGVARLLVPSTTASLADLDLEERSTWQFSLVPNVSTNGDIAGATINTFSFNLLAGYARGLEGIEVGGIANLESRDVKGLQVAGLTNLVGRNTDGVQIAGAINHTMRSLNGLQIAGFGNTVWDTLVGVQIAGGANVVKGGLRGTQITGGCNVATQNVDGTQIAGGVNVTPMDVRKAQIAGGVNYARNVSGAQFACGVNVARDTVGGGQVGFGGNYARHVSGGQVSFGVNVVSGAVSGGQVGFGGNYAGSVTGGQFSFGANVVPGKVEAGQVGFGLNYAGSITGGQFTFGLNVVSGTASGGQVGAVNFARRCEGVQFGILNISDTITGVPIGLLSIVRKGYHSIDVSSTEVMDISVTLRTGVRAFHNLLIVSADGGPNGALGFGYGFGSTPRLSEHSGLEIEASGEQVLEQGVWIPAVNIAARFGVRYAYTFAHRITLFAGPSLNTMVSDWRNDEGEYLSQVPPAKTLYAERIGTVDLRSWIGYRVGLGVRF